ncbi:MAG: LytR family transcriptional regulator [Anaerolineales bacterium]|nr:MAG: LytR family transcriptional regulator [Anaerolineales bacterium]
MEGAATQDRRPLAYLADGLVLTVVLALVTVVGHNFLAPDQQSTQALADSATSVPTPTDSPVPSPTPTVTPSPPPTSTPASTPALTPTPTASSVVSSTEGVTTSLPIPSPAPLVEQPEDTINLLLLGSDQSTGGNPGRTDVIVVVTIFPDPPSVSLLSIPRDLYVYVPDVGFERINLAYRRGEQANYEGGGIALLQDTIEYNLGIRVHRWAQVDFDGFIGLVDALGGVEIPVECPLTDTFPDPDSEDGQTDVDWEPGIYFLDGKHTLWYVRSRWSTSDLDRNRRQQQVLRGLYDQIVTLDVILRIPEVWDALGETVSTDLKLEELIHLASIGSGLDPTDVRSFLITKGIVQGYVAPSGAQVLLAYEAALRELVDTALTPPAADRVDREPFRVEVWNATGDEGLGRVAALRLGWEGFAVVSVSQVESQYAQTLLFDYTTSPKGSPVPLLSSLYGLPGNRVIYAPAADRETDFRLVLGADYDPCLATRVNWWPEDLPTPTPVATPSTSP